MLLLNENEVIQWLSFRSENTLENAKSEKSTQFQMSANVKYNEKENRLSACNQDYRGQG